MKHYPVSLVALAVVALISSPSYACEKHKDGHAALTTAAAAPAPTVVPAPAAAPAMSIKDVEAAGLSVPEPAGYAGCARMKNKQTVYLTQ